MRAYRLPQTPAQRPGGHSYCLSCSPKLQGKESNSLYQKPSPLFVWVPPPLTSCADLHAMSTASPSQPSSGEASSTCVLTLGFASMFSLSSHSSLRVYLAFPVMASMEPLLICCLMAQISRKKGSPTVSWGKERRSSQQTRPGGDRSISRDRLCAGSEGAPAHRGAGQIHPRCCKHLLGAIAPNSHLLLSEAAQKFSDLWQHDSTDGEEDTTANNSHRPFLGML